MCDILKEKKEFLKSKFSFLISNGFTYLGKEETNIILIYSYKKDDLILTVSFDIREHIISINLRDINNHDVVNLLTNILDSKIGDEEARETLKVSIQRIYKESEKYKYGMIKEHFESIILLYVDFIEKNIGEITRWKYKKKSNRY